MRLFATAFSFRTRLAPEGVLARLRAAADQSDPRRGFDGDVAETGFRLSRINHNHPYGAASAWMEGRVTLDAGGAMVSGSHAPSALVVAGSAVALGGLLAIGGRIVLASLASGGPFRNFAIPIGLAAAALLVCVASLRLATRTDLAALAQIVEAEGA